MKKISALLIAMALMIGILGACGGSSSASKDASKVNQSPDKIKGDITVWGWNVAADAMKQAIPAFNKKYPNVKVTVQDIGRLDVYKKLTVGLAANGSGLPDVSLVEDDHMASYAKQFPNGFADLSKLGFDKYASDFAPSKVAAVKNASGDFIGMPWDAGPVLVYYRTDLYKKAGVDPSTIKTWDDYIAAGKKIKAATGVGMMTVDKANDDGFFRTLLNEEGTYYFDKNGNIDLNSQAAVKAMTVEKKLNDAGLLVDSNGWNGGIAAFKNGKIASIPSAVWYTGTMMDQAPEQKGKWDVYPLPAFTAGGNTAANLGGSDLTVLNSSKNKAAAYAFAKFFTTDKQTQINSMKKDGLFPSLLSTYSDPVFTQPVPYYNNQPVFKEFSDVVKNIPAINYTSDNARALKIGADAQGAVLLNNTPVQKALSDAANKLAQATGRKINK